MKRIKKTIDIILISIAIAVMVVLADRIIPFKDLNASLKTGYTSMKEGLDENTGRYEPAREYRSEMVIDTRLFMPAQDIFAVATVSAAEDKDIKDTKSVTEKNTDLGETASEEPGDVNEAGEVEYTYNENAAAGQHSAEEEEVVQQQSSIDYSKSEDFRIEIDLSRQRVIVLYKDEILREMICSGGAPESPTPLGEYVTSEKIEYAWVERFGVGAYYWIRFFEDYLIHSVPFDENGEMIVEEYEKLGKPASHGCIRLQVEEAKWLYEMLPLGVKVAIY